MNGKLIKGDGSMNKIGTMLVLILIFTSLMANLGAYSAMEFNDVAEAGSTMPVSVPPSPCDEVDWSLDVPTWSIGTRWTYYQDGWANTSDDDVPLDRLYIKERLNFTVSSIEYVDIQGDIVPVYNVTKEGDVLGGDGFADTAMIGAFNITIEEGYSEGYTLHRMDDLGLIYDYNIRYMIMTIDDGTLEGETMYTTTEDRFSHDPIVEIYDFPLNPSDYFFANNTVNATGYNEVLIMGIEIDVPYEYMHNLTRHISVSPETLSINVPAGNYDTLLVFENVSGEDNRTELRHYNGDVQNYVREQINGSEIEWIRVLEDYHIPDNPNHLKIESSEAFVGESVTITGSFPDHPWENFNVTIPMAGIFEEVQTDGSGNFSLDIVVPYAEDNTPSPGLIGSLGVIAQKSYAEEPYQVATLTILEDPDYIKIEPLDETISAGDDITYTATAYDSNDEPLRDVTQGTVWDIDAEAGGNWVGSTYTSEGADTWTVTGTFLGFTDETTLTVIPGSPEKIRITPTHSTIIAGASQGYMATVYDEFDNIIDDVTWDTNWSIQEGSGGEWVDNEYTSEFVGNWTVTGNHSGFIDTATLVVQAGAADHIEISPTESTITAGESESYTAVAFDEYGNDIGDVTDDATWEIDTEAGGEWVGSTYTSEIAGVWTVTANYLGIRGYATLNVNHGPLDHIEITPSHATITAGETQAYNVTAYDEFGNEISDVTDDTDWEIEAEAGGGWLDNVYTSEISGTWTITATYDSFMNFATVTVEPGSAQYIEISPKERQVIAGGAVTYTATAYDEFGNQFGVTSETNWSIEEEAGGSWTDNIYRSEIIGVWNVTGSYGDLTDNGTLIVEMADLEYIDITPSVSTVIAGDSITYTATAYDGEGNHFDITEDVNWDIDPGAGGSWTNNVYTSEVVGSWTVVGTYDNFTDTAEIHVEAGEPVSIVVYPIDSTLIAGEHIMYTSVAYNEFGIDIGDVTHETNWTIDPEAGGLWDENWYTTQLAGAWTVTGTFGELSNATTLTVEPNVVYSVVVTPYEDQTIEAGDVLTFAAEARDIFGNLIQDDPDNFTWHNATNGLFNKVSTGTYHVSASYEGVMSPTTAVTVVSSDTNEFLLHIENITAGERPVIRILDAMDIYGNPIEGEYYVNITIDGLSMDPIMIFFEGEAEHQWIHINQTGPYDATVSIDGVVREDVFYVGMAEIFSFVMNVENITVGEQPGIEISDAQDLYENALEGEYPVTIVMGETTVTENLTFTDGDSQHMWYPITIHGEYDMSVEIEGTTRTDRFWVFTSEVISFELSIDNITAGEQPSIIILDARDGYDNLIEGMYDVAMDLNGGELTTSLYFEMGHTVQVWDPIYENGEYDVSVEIDGVHVMGTFWVLTSDVTSFDVSVGDITAGEHPLITIDNVKDGFENPVEGEYLATLSINGNSLITHIWFESGEAEHLWYESLAQTGMYNATITINGFIGYDDFYVWPAGLHRVEIYPADTLTITAGQTIEFSATAYDEYGNVITDVAADFSWENTIEGLFYNTTAGIYDVTATYNGVTSSATTVTVVPATAEHVIILPSDAVTVTAGEERTFSAEAYDGFGNLITDTNTDFVWQNADGFGVFKRNSAGLYTVTATYQGVTSEPTAVSVVPADVNSVVIAPASSRTITAGQTMEFSATAYDSFGNIVEEDNTMFSWYNTDADGMFNITTTGTYEVTASYNGVTSSPTLVTVVPGSAEQVVITPGDTVTVIAGEERAFSAQAYDGFDNLISETNTDFVWRNTDGFGVFKKNGAGLYTVTATYMGVTSELTAVSVVPADVSSVVVAPGSSRSINAGQIIEFSATAYDSFGNLVEDDDSMFTWNNTDSNGLFQETTEGTYEVVASYHGITSSPCIVTVVPGSAEQVVITPSDTVTVTAGDEITFSAEAYDGFGNLITDTNTDFVWRNTDGFGVFKKNGAGLYTVTATYMGVTSESTAVSVVPTDASTVVISPSSSRSITAGQTIEFSAIAYDSFGNIVEEDNTRFSWTNADSNGVFLETTAGNYEVTAGFQEVISQSIRVVVSPDEAADITITPENSRITAGITQSYSAIGVDEYGNEFDVTDRVSWSIDVGAGGWWMNNVYVSRIAGSWVVTGIYGSLEDTAMLEVESGTTSSIKVSPSSSSIVAGESQIFTVSGYDEYGNLYGDVSSDATWTIDRSAGGSWDGNEYTAEIRGIWTVTVRHGVLRSRVTLTVEAGPVHSVSIGPEDVPVIPTGYSIEFTAEARDSWGNLITDDVRDFTWLNAERGVLSKDSPGEYAVTATYDIITSRPTTVFVDEARFEISVVDHDTSVKTGERIVVEYRVINTGGVQGTQDIEFTLGGRRIKAHRALTLQPGQEFLGSFSWRPEEEGTYEMGVAGKDGRETISVDVEEEDSLPWILGILAWVMALLALLLIVIAIWLFKNREDEYPGTIDDEEIGREGQNEDMHTNPIEERYIENLEKRFKLSSYKEDLESLNTNADKMMDD